MRGGDRGPVQAKVAKSRIRLRVILRSPELLCEIGDRLTMGGRTCEAGDQWEIPVIVDCRPRLLCEFGGHGSRAAGRDLRRGRLASSRGEPMGYRQGPGADGGGARLRPASRLL